MTDKGIDGEDYLCTAGVVKLRSAMSLENNEVSR